LTTIRVDPSQLRRAALEISRDAERMRLVGEEVMRVTQAAPSYDGEFGPRVSSIGVEGPARLMAEADRLSELSRVLLRKAEAFEAVDAQAQAGINDVGRTLRSWQDAGLNFLAGAGLSWAEVLRALATGSPSGDGPEDEPPPPGLQWLLGFLGELWRALFLPAADGAAKPTSTPMPGTPAPPKTPTMAPIPTAAPTPDGTPTPEEIRERQREAQIRAALWAAAQQRLEEQKRLAAVKEELRRLWEVNDPALAQELLHTEIEKAFDPFAGDLPPTVEYSGSFYQGLDRELGLVYQRDGINLQELAASRRANELTEEILLEHSADWVYVDPKGAELGLLEWVQARGRMAVDHEQYAYFLDELDIDSQNWMNFEPNYLDAMMKTHPAELQAAQRDYLASILEMHGNDAREALRWMQTHVETVGTE